MSTKKKLLEAAAGAAGGEAVYVDDVFSTYLYAGTGSSQNIVTGIDLSGEGGLVWTKSRTSAVSNQLTDTVSGYRLESDDTYAGEASQGNVTFNSNGHTQATGSSFFNDSGNDFVNWTFRKAPGFFDIVTYTGDGTAGRTVSHNLGSVPGMLLVKRTDSTDDWRVFHRSQPNKYANLNSTFQFQTDGGNVFGNPSNGTATAPTSTHFTVDGGDAAVNASGGTYVAYLFAHDAQDFGTDSDEAIIKCGSYTGNGSTNGPTIDLGFEPQWLLIKNATASSNWMMVDNMRGLPVGGDDATLAADTSDAENGVIGAVAAVNILPNGWKNVGGITASNANGATHIYMAIRRPNKPASKFAATDLFTPASGLNASANGKVFATTYPVDLSIATNTVDNGVNWYTFDRMRGGGKYLWTDSTNVEASISNQDQFDHMDGLYTTNAYNYSSPLWIGYEWRRAPGLFDIVAYTGTGSARTVTHNLGVAPEMMWIKNRSAITHWPVYYGNSGKYMHLSLSDAETNSGSFWNSTSPTQDLFTVGSSNQVNGSGNNHIAYLFASVPGISKVGSYTGTGGDLNVDCGFSAGARFVLIKRTDASGDWYVYDSTRGIAAGNDPYLLLNSTNGGVTNTDYIDPLASGFTVTSGAPAALNNTGGTYIFYAIA